MSIIIVALPSNFIYYAAPPLFLIGVLFLETAVSARRLILCIIVMLLFTFFSVYFSISINDQVNIPGLLFGMAMYLPLLILIAQHPCFHISNFFVYRLVLFLRLFLYIQVAASVLQIALGSLRFQGINGDFISGTFGLFDMLTVVTISQVLFTFCIINVSVFLSNYRNRRGIKLAIVLSLLCCVLAQSGHQIIFFAASLLILAALQKRSLSRLIQAAMLVMILAGVVHSAYPTTFRTAIDWAEKVMLSNQSPKRNIVESALEELLSTDRIVVGMGLGQFSSRAALFSSGDYLNKQLPPLLTGKSSLFIKYVAPQIWLFDIMGENSAIAAPYFSILSVVSEFGPLLSLVLLIIAIRAIHYNAKLSNMENAEIRGLGLYCNFFIIFIFLNSFIENYLEMVQANLVPILLYIIAQARSRGILAAEHPVSSRSQATAGPRRGIGACLPRLP